MCESRQTARKVTYCLATAFQEYSKSIRAADAGSKRFAIDLRSPEDLEAELRAADSSDAWFSTYALRPTPLWPYRPYRPRLEDDSRLRLYTEAISTVVVTKSSSVFCRIFLSHPRMRLLDLISLIIRIQSPLRVECFNHVSQPYPRLISCTVGLEVYYLSLLQKIDNFVASCFEIATRHQNLASIFN